MKLRLILLVEYILRFADFIRSLPIVTLRPKDMTDFSHNAYEQHYHKKTDNNEKNVTGELVSDELWLWERIPSRKGEIGSPSWTILELFWLQGKWEYCSKS